MDTNKLSEISGSIIKNTKEILNLDNALICDDTIQIVDSQKESTIMESALSSDFNSSSELDAKKILSASLLIAKKLGVLPPEISQSISSTSSASLADEAISRMKVAYKISTGVIDVYEATDKLIDRATARLVAVSDRYVELGIDFAVNTVGNIIAKIYPPAKPIVTVIKVFQPYLTSKAQQFVKKGIQKLNSIAKNSLRKVKDFITTKVSNTIANLLS